MVQTSKCAKGYTVLSPLPPPVPNFLVPFPEATSATHFFWIRIYKQIYTYIFLSSINHKWEVHHTHFCTLPFHWEIIPY